MRLLLTLFLTGLCFLVRAQSTTYDTIDSLRASIASMPPGDDREKAVALHDLATLYMHTANYVQAANYYAESLVIAKRLNDELLMALIYRNMGVLSYNQSDYAKTDEYHQKALMIYEKRNDNIRKAGLLKSMADNMLQANDSLNARRYYQEAIAVFRSTNNKISEAMALSNFALTYNTNYTEKIALALKAQKIFDSVYTENPIPAINAGNIGVAYFDIVRYNHSAFAPPGPDIPGNTGELLLYAEKYIRRAIDIATSKQDVANASYFTGVLAELQEFNGDYKNAYKNIRIYFETSDSIYSQSNKNQIANLQSKLELDLKNAEIEKGMLQVRNQRTQLLLLASGLLLVVVTGIIIYRENRIGKRNNRMLKDLNEQLSTANRLKTKFFAILSHDLRSPVARLVNFLQFRKLQPAALDPGQAAQHEQRISDSAEALLATMEGLLIWSKDQMDHFQPVMHAVVVDRVFQYLERNFNNVDKVRFRFIAEPGMTLFTDENYLQVILYNLTSNSVNVLQSTASASITWKAWKSKEADFLSIADNGPGIPADQAMRFFDGLSSSDSRHGLGLHIVRDLARAIDCTLSVAPSPGGLTLLLRFSSQPSIS